ncbi:disintegrin and metalloproteinase domain-containing protein 10-like isoform X3 [Mya arenaria]|uniref:disintegrin and metalloproteinase domain-containing protein 10-like isoform X3 n=1 Tax=Mya arenaria TaxID=6604 RepID=UPI0022E3A1D1|nr:disintegrin and metalloproteinase domain-containing protein 10-like isoform X3 [Mya arenaria]
MDFRQCLSYFAIFATIFLQYLTECNVLDDYILHYEELNYDTEAVHNSHLRHKRSIDPAVHLDINAFERPFKLKLTRDTSSFSSDFQLEFNGTLLTPDLSFLYSGELKDQPGSKVQGAIIQGIFTGSIHVPSEKEVYHVEKSKRFFEHSPVFHSVIYRESDMNLDPFSERRTRERREAKQQGSCGNDNAQEWMRQTVANEIVTPNVRAKRHSKEWQGIHSAAEGSASKYTAQANSKTLHRAKRETVKDFGNLRNINSKKNTCIMALRADPFFWDRYMEKANGNAELAKDEILAFFDSHIKAIREIYSKTRFQTYNGDMFYTQVSFVVQRSKIMTRTGCTNGDYSSMEQPFCNNNIDVSNFLNLNSLIDHDLFCLSYAFTYRDFIGGTLGLAWVGSPGGASGGLCERRKPFSEGGKSVSKSLNTGIVTTINYGKEVATKVSQLTFAHEVGHNFGSPHDVGDAECAPYGTSQSGASQGNYIMFASATMGDKPHNSQFSICSKDNITRVIHAVLTSSSKYNCFTEEGTAYCGNGIVEGEEECDCGFYDDCDDGCCTPQDKPFTDAAKFCKRTENALCSPSEGPCCDPVTCSYKNHPAQTTICRAQQECSDIQYCNNTSPECPPSVLVANGRFCNNYGFTCINGECAGSLCAAFGWEECFTTGASKTKEEQEALCKLGCMEHANGTVADCIISNDKKITETGIYSKYWNMLKNVTDGRKGDDDATIESGVKLAPGSPCNNFQGYCDVFYRCRGVDAEGPLSRLKNLIFNPKTLEDIKNWIVEYWWAVLLISVGVIITMGLFIKFCAVHTPSSNPKAKPARKLSETMTLKRRKNQNRGPPQQVQYQASRGARPESSQGPPPPYPGSSTSASSSQWGPPHGHGKKGKARKQQNSVEMGRI